MTDQINGLLITLFGVLSMVPAVPPAYIWTSLLLFALYRPAVCAGCRTGAS